MTHAREVYMLPVHGDKFVAYFPDISGTYPCAKTEMEALDTLHSMYPELFSGEIRLVSLAMVQHTKTDIPS